MENYLLCFYTHKVFMSIRIVESLVKYYIKVSESYIKFSKSYKKFSKSYKKVSGSCDLTPHPTTRTQ